MLGNLIGGFIVILVGVSLIGIVADLTYDAQNNVTGTGSVTGASSTIVGLVPLFYALGIMSAGVALAAQGLRAAGMLGV